MRISFRVVNSPCSVVPDGWVGSVVGSFSDTIVLGSKVVVVGFTVVGLGVVVGTRITDSVLSSEYLALS